MPVGLREVESVNHLKRKEFGGQRVAEDLGLEAGG